LVNHLRDGTPLREKRPIIKYGFKTARNAFSLRKIHKYTPKSVTKTVYLNVLLPEPVISLGFDKNVDL
jgi:hypothetical protein